MDISMSPLSPAVGTCTTIRLCHSPARPRPSIRRSAATQGADSSRVLLHLTSAHAFPYHSTHKVALVSEEMRR
jgi:hypothetical protein